MGITSSGRRSISGFGVCGNLSTGRGEDEGETDLVAGLLPADLAPPVALERSNDLVQRDMLRLRVLGHVVFIVVLVENPLREELGLQQPRLRP